MFKLYQGKVKNVYLPVTASTALSEGSLVTFSSGKLVAATSGTAAVNIVGVLVKAIASTDDDYADERLVAVQVPTERHAVWEADVTATVATSDIGAEVDLTDASTINPDAGSVDVARIVDVISTTKAHVFLKIAGSY